MLESLRRLKSEKWSECQHGIPWHRLLLLLSRKAPLTGIGDTENTLYPGGTSHRTGILDTVFHSISHKFTTFSSPPLLSSFSLPIKFLPTMPVGSIAVYRKNRMFQHGSKWLFRSGLSQCPNDKGRLKVSYIVSLAWEITHHIHLKWYPLFRDYSRQETPEGTIGCRASFDRLGSRGGAFYQHMGPWSRFRDLLWIPPLGWAASN